MGDTSGDKAVFEAILNAKAEGTPLILATIIRDQGSVPRHAGSKMVVYPDGRIEGSIGGGEMESRVIARAPDILASGQPEVIHVELSDPERGDPGVCGGQVDIFVEPIMPDPTILIVGAGHCGQALAGLASWLGYRVIVTDDRADLCNAEVIPEADAFYVVPPEAIPTQIPIHERTYIAAVTRGVPLDVKMIPGLLGSPAPFIGVMGSRRRWAVAVKKLKENGVSERDLSRIHAPIGLELNAETPHEIAVSIMAEIIAFQRGGDGSSMKWQGTPEEASSAS
jgi:xanthine dehydrogenase accessory factor